MTKFDTLMAAERPFLTDGGMETWMFFVEGFEAPEFAAIVLMDDEPFRAKLRSYFDRFLALAQASGTGFVLDTNTWRGCVGWAQQLGLNKEQILALTRGAAEYAKEIRSQWLGRVPDILVNGVIGPAGDGYAAQSIPSAAEAQALHAPQIGVFAEEGVDMLSALTINNVGEAIGITRAAQQAGLPVVMSFTVETDGRLPSGDMLGEAIEAVDAATDSGPAYYMVNCAHPDHFRTAIANSESWTARIGGLRANASRMSHEELDNSEELDDGDPGEFGHLHAQLARLLPNLRVVGGCCGTDHRHVGAISRELHLESAG